jgi:hypothetical protein
VIVSPNLRSTLIVLPCSASKFDGGLDHGQETITNYLPADLAAVLAASRAQNAEAARVSGPPMPAWRRYKGSLYDAGGLALRALVEAHSHVLILSGGYGVVCADEPIAWYDLRFEPRNWPGRLIEKCLQAYVQRHRLTRVRALMGASTPYAKVIRRTTWAEAGADDSFLITPEFHAGGAIRAVPVAIGESLTALTAGGFTRDWASSQGIRFRWESLA